MEYEYWKKQTSDSPLFPDLQWSRPENRAQAGKLLIVGGNSQGFSAPAEAFSHTNNAGIGVARVLLPDALQKSIGRVFEAGEYAPSTPSGSFASRSLAELLALSHWADGVLLAGDLGRNSETAIVIEKFLSKYSGQVTVTKDAIEYITSQPIIVKERPNTLLVLSFSQLQRLVIALKLPLAITLDMDLFRTIETLHSITKDYPFSIITQHLGQTFVATDGEVSTTPCAEGERVWRLKRASNASVWWLQNPSKTFEALTTSLL